MKRFALFLLLSACPALADDVLFTVNGESRTGRITFFDGRTIRMQVPLPPPPGTPAGAPSVFASVTVSRSDVDRIEFSADPALEALIVAPKAESTSELAKRWEAARIWLDVPRSTAGRVGVAYGEALLKSGGEANATKALEIFSLVEEQTWDTGDARLAKQGRLRAKVATGRAAEAIEEASKLAGESEDPSVLIEAKFILAEAQAAALRKLVEDNPRWEEDIFVRPEYEKLRSGSLDLYLYPYLFFGSESDAAARGLWGALQVHDFVGNKAEALECARDLAAIYPTTKFAKFATDYIQTLPPDLRAVDPEKEAKETYASPPAEEKPSQPSKPKNEKKSKPKS